MCYWIIIIISRSILYIENRIFLKKHREEIILKSIFCRFILSSSICLTTYIVQQTYAHTIDHRFSSFLRVIYCEFIRITFNSILWFFLFLLFFSSGFLRPILFFFFFFFFFSRFVLNVRSVYDSQSIRRHRLLVVTIKHSLTFLCNIYIYMCTLSC